MIKYCNITRRDPNILVEPQPPLIDQVKHGQRDPAFRYALLREQILQAFSGDFARFDIQNSNTGFAGKLPPFLIDEALQIARR